MARLLCRILLLSRLIITVPPISLTIFSHSFASGKCSPIAAGIYSFLVCSNNWSVDVFGFLAAINGASLVPFFVRDGFLDLVFLADFFPFLPSKELSEEGLPTAALGDEGGGEGDDLAAVSCSFSLSLSSESEVVILDLAVSFCGSLTEVSEKISRVRGRENRITYA
jgi:hypothetical protein